MNTTQRSYNFRASTFVETESLDSVSEVDYDTSISKYESERGTHGRGTPPPREIGQPRLDELFRKLQVIYYWCTLHCIDRNLTWAHYASYS